MTDKTAKEGLCTCCKNDFIPMEGKCCSYYQYWSSDAKKCDNCHHACYSCFGNLANQCTGCRPGKAFKDNVSPGTCVDVKKGDGKVACAAGYTLINNLKCIIDSVANSDCEQKKIKAFKKA